MKLGMTLFLACIFMTTQAMEPEAHPMEVEQPQPALYLGLLPDELQLPLIQEIVFNDISSAQTIEDAVQKIQNKATVSEQFGRILNDHAVVKSTIDALVAKFPQETHNNPIFAALYLATPGAQWWIERNSSEWPQALFVATARNKIPFVQKLLAAGVDPNVRDEINQTALFIAARDGYTEIVQILLAAGADPNLQNKYGRTPLMYAAGRVDIKIVRMLLDAGANPTVKSRFEDAFALAARNIYYDRPRSAQVMELLRKAIKRYNKNQPMQKKRKM